MTTEEIRREAEDKALREYNEAYKRWVFCTESEEKEALEAFNKARSNWVNL